jgi:hydrogenase nickel incorporation protein HypA/HybF
MHELSVALSLIEVAGEQLERQGQVRACAVHVRLGPLSGVVVEALRSAYELAREGTPFASAELIIEETPLVVHCPTCAAERTLTSPLLVCPECGTPTPDVVMGRELELFALEVA